VDAPFDVLPAERLLRPESIVRSAANAQIRALVAASQRPGIDVIQLEKCRGFAALAVRADIGASASKTSSARSTTTARSPDGFL
jgi:hypothetical protein